MHIIELIHVMHGIYYTLTIVKKQEVLIMTLSKYEIFIRVVELGSLTKAAKELGYTQSAVSHALAALESEAELKLLSRSRAGVFLTPDGEKLMPMIRKMVDARQEFAEALASIHGIRTGCVRIGAFTSVAVHWLPGMIKEYGADHPGTEIKMLNGDYHDIVQWFLNGSIDIGFVTEKTNIPRCEYIPLMEDKLLIALPKNHRLAGREVIRVEEIENEPFIGLLETSDQDARSVLDQAGVSVNVKFTTKDDYAIIAMVEQGLGISIMPQLLLEGRSDEIWVAQIEGGKKRTIGIAVSPEGQRSPSVQSFAKYIQKWVKERYE